MVGRALRSVYQYPAYWFLSGVVAFATTPLVLLWQNLALLQVIWTNSAATLASKLAFTNALLLGTTHSLGWLPVGLVVLSSVLLSVTLSLGVYVWRHHRGQLGRRTSAATVGGSIAAVLGVGCVACGPLLLGSAFAVLGASGVLLLLPLHGAEFGLIAVGLFSYALYALAKVISAPATCAL